MDLPGIRIRPGDRWLGDHERRYIVAVKRLVFIVLALLLLAGIGVVAWTVAGLPPVRMVWRYGFSFQPEPTGKVVPIGGIDFVEIGPGCFRMGSNQGTEGGDFLGRWCARLGLPWGDHPQPSDEMPVHWVEFPRGYFIARTEVTNAQYEAFDPDHGRGVFSRGNRDPVVQVSWEDAEEYCAWLSEKSGMAIRLPSESEWECACRAGSKREFCFGNDDNPLTRYAWFNANSRARAHEVATGRANAWGLHDFHGNVWEWCADTWHESYRGAPTDGTAWTEEGSVGRVHRGGSWRYPAAECRSANRLWRNRSYRLIHLGFRLALSPLDR